MSRILFCTVLVSALLGIGCDEGPSPVGQQRRRDRELKERNAPLLLGDRVFTEGRPAIGTVVKSKQNSAAWDIEYADGSRVGLDTVKVYKMP
jgi:preprotein translocase subunit YajC